MITNGQRVALLHVLLQGLCTEFEMVIHVVEDLESMRDEPVFFKVSRHAVAKQRVVIIKHALCLIWHFGDRVVEEAAAEQLGLLRQHCDLVRERIFIILL